MTTKTKPAWPLYRFRAAGANSWSREDFIAAAAHPEFVLPYDAVGDLNVRCPLRLEVWRYASEEPLRPVLWHAECAAWVVRAVAREAEGNSLAYELAVRHRRPDKRRASLRPIARTARLSDLLKALHRYGGPRHRAQPRLLNTDVCFAPAKRQDDEGGWVIELAESDIHPLLRQSELVEYIAGQPSISSAV